VIVVDASAMVLVLTGHRDGQRVADLIANDDAVAPELLDVEVMSTLKGLERSKQLGRRATDRALDLLLTAPVARISHASIVRTAWELRHNLSAYDAAYVALAKDARAVLVTADRPMAAAAAPAVAVTLV
jgi:predicted nucleic acid-binding protein